MSLNTDRDAMKRSLRALRQALALAWETPGRDENATRLDEIARLEEIIRSQAARLNRIELRRAAEDGDRARALLEAQGRM